MWQWILSVWAMCAGAAHSAGGLELAGRYRFEIHGTGRAVPVLVRGEGDLILLQLSHPELNCEIVVERSGEGLVRRLRSRGKAGDEAAAAGRELASLLQLSPYSAREHTRRETDTAGNCLATYTPDTEYAYNKLRTDCRWEGGADGLEGALESRRLVHVQLDPQGVLQAVVSTERHELRGLTVLHKVTLMREGDLPPEHAAPLELDRLGPLEDLPLPPLPPSPSHLPPTLPADTVVGVLREERAALAVLLHDGELQEDVALVARAASRLARALRAAPGQLATVARDDPSSRPALLLSAGAAGLPPSAVLPALQRDSPLDRELLELYLGTLAGSPHLVLDAARQVARLATDKWGERVRRAAELCAAAGGAADSLPRCSGRDEECVERRLWAGAAGVDELVRRAAAGSPGAVTALETHDPTRLSAEQLALLASVAAREDLPIETRASALAVAVRGALEQSQHCVELPEWLTELSVSLHGAGAVRDVLWGLLRELADARPCLVDPLTRLRRRHPHLDSWYTRATEGESSVLRRSVCAGGTAGVCGVLWSVQVVSDGAVRGGRVSLHAGGIVLAAADVRARGLADTDREDAAAELRITLGGARRIPLELFSGRADLLAKLWGGAASTPRLLAAHLALADREVLMPSGAGRGGWLRGVANDALLLRVTARGDASLWNRAADGALWLHAGVSWSTSLQDERGSGDCSWQLAVGAQLDFYSEPRLCVHADLPPHRTRNDPRTVTRLAGRSLALDRRNDRACADMR